MADEDLSKLIIDKSPAPGHMKRRRRPVLIAVIAVIGIVVAAFLGQRILDPAVSVEAAVVARIYPSQAFTLLNASGYVVAQHKAAVASK